MTALDQFQQNIVASDRLIAMYVELRRARGLGARGRLNGANQELLWLPRSAVVSAISSLDTYVHKVVRDRLAVLVQGQGAAPALPDPLCESLAELIQIKNAAGFRQALPLLMAHDTMAKLLESFDEKRLQFMSFQAPDKVIEAYSLIGSPDIFARVSDLWPGPNTAAADLKRRLASYVQRRNQIAHEGDLEKNGNPRPMQPDYAIGCREFVVNLVNRLDQVIHPPAAA